MRPLLSLAPMEGITTHIYRNALHKYYGGVDLFYSPFISTHKNKTLNSKELRDILPENNPGIQLIPQILPGGFEDFYNTARQVGEVGYQHININFGCPSGTVTAKGKGAGILNTPKVLEALLDDIFSKTEFEISIKTRLGFEFYEEWEDLLRVYMKFPLKKLIIHARVRQDFYKEPVRKEYVKESLQVVKEKFPIAYNGDICSVDDAKTCEEEMSGIEEVMIGRGLIRKPSLARDIKFSDSAEQETWHSKERFLNFNKEIMEQYKDILKDDKNTLFRMKELWFYMADDFPEGTKLLKKIQKCNSLREYEGILMTL